MDAPVLSDPEIFPTDAVLSSHLRKSKPAFAALFEFNHTHHPDFQERWRYYNDGKSWLMNVSRKKKTLFWLSVRDGWFRTSFYLNARAAECIPASAIPAPLKKQFQASEGEKFRALTVVIKAKKDVEIYKEVLKLKMATL